MEHVTVINTEMKIPHNPLACFSENQHHVQRGPEQKHSSRSTSNQQVSIKAESPICITTSLIITAVHPQADPQDPVALVCNTKYP